MVVCLKMAGKDKSALVEAEFKILQYLGGEVVRSRVTPTERVRELKINSLLGGGGA